MIKPHRRRLRPAREDLKVPLLGDSGLEPRALADRKKILEAMPEVGGQAPRHPPSSENLYLECLMLKKQVNALQQHNLKLKTANSQLQRENKSATNPPSEGMTLSLKGLVRELKRENEQLAAELARVKRQLKYTKIQELEY
jgi:hypothetical protein